MNDIHMILFVNGLLAAWVVWWFPWWVAIGDDLRELPLALGMVLGAGVICCSLSLTELVPTPILIVLLLGVGCGLFSAIALDKGLARLAAHRVNKQGGNDGIE